MKSKISIVRICTFLCVLGLLLNSGAVFAQGEGEPTPASNTAPTIILTEPQQNITIQTGEKVSIAWTDDDPDDSALVSLAYDVDSDPTNDDPIHWIAQNLPEDSDEDGDRFEWDTTGIPAGTYYLWAVISDSVNAPTYALAAGTLTILEAQSPTQEPTTVPTEEPTAIPTEEPTVEPTGVPTTEPTQIPTEEPSPAPTQVPTTEPTQTPTVEPTKEPEKPFSWELVVDLNDVAKEVVDQSLKSAYNELSGQDVSIQIDGNQLVMKGERDIEQLRFALFDSSLDGFDFLGGPIELNISMPTDGSPVTLKLEDRITTGYVWYLISSPEGSNITQSGESTFESRHSGIGASCLQTIKLTPAGEEDVVINLVYQRPFEPGSEVKAELNLSLSDPYDVINLSDPTPKQIIAHDEVEESGQSNPIDELVVDAESLPSSFDWRSAGIVPAVRNQKTCGSCWAFGAVGIMESAIRKAGGPMIDLSEQFLVSCNIDGWNCSSGGIAHKYHYNTLGKNQTAIGAVLESAKPYTATNGSCTAAYNHPYKLSNWNFIVNSPSTLPTVNQIKTAIYNYGPVAVGMCVGPAFEEYKGGVFSIDEWNVCAGGRPNHLVILVGWNDSTQSWILRNSYGTDWGENGYMRIKYNTSRVGLGTTWVIFATPTLDSPNGTIYDTTPTYTWTKINSATQYLVELYRSTLIYTKTVTSSFCGTSSCTSTPSNILSAGSYKWRVSAYLNGSWRTFSDLKSFTVVIPVPKPAAPSGTIYDTTPTYSWNKINGVTKYYYQLFKGSTLVYSRTTLASTCGTSVCTSTPSDVLSPGDYKWYIRAYAGDTWHPWSSPMNFTVLNSVPKPTSPSGTIYDTTPIYIWSTVNDATHYSYQLFNSTGSLIYTQTVSPDVCGHSTCSSKPPTVLNPGDYKWSIRAYVGGAWRAWSSPMNFTVLNSVPKPISPSGTIYDTTPTYSWNKINGVTKYYYQLFKGSTLVYSRTTLASTCGTSVCTSTPSDVLSPGDYKWYIRAYAGDTWHPWSSPMNFTVSNGFDSQFTTNASGWTPLNGTWNISSGYYQSAGLAEKIVTSAHEKSYNVLTYQVKMKRTGCSSCSYGILFNGTPSPISSMGRWYKGYAFYVNNDGYFTIGKFVNGTWNPIVSWTKNAAINYGWNILKVTYNEATGFVQFYVNGSRVASGTFSSYGSGQVGIGFYRSDSTPTQLYVEYAVLSTSAPSSSASSIIDGILIDETLIFDNAVTQTASISDFQGP